MGRDDFVRKRRLQTLEELERDVWPEPTFPSHVVTASHSLRRKPIGELSVEDLRLLIGQGIGLLFLMPLALEELERDPFSEGDLFPGDLLLNVLRSLPSHWARHREHRVRLLAILQRFELEAPGTDVLDGSLGRDFEAAIQRFRALED